MTPLLALIAPYVEYLEDERQLAKATVHAYRSDALAFARRFDQPVETITRNDLRLYMRELKVAGYKPSTIRRIFHGFGTLWKWLYVEKHVPEIPTENLVLPRKNITLPRWLSEDEFSAYLRVCYGEKESARQRAAWLFLARTGVRPTELRNLLVRDVNQDEWLVTVRNTKSRVDRVLPVVDDRLQDLMADLAANKAVDDVMFSGAFGNLWDRERMRLGFEGHLRKAGLFNASDPITPYALRHTVGTRLALAGVPVHVIKEWMGHKDIRTTMIYLHTAPMDLRTAALKLFK